MSLIDIAVIAAYFIASIFIAVLMTKKSGKNTEEFFLSGRKMPWWLAGTAMVATTFAADTPLAVTELVVRNGISGNWLWWNMVAGNMLTVFFFAHLWRRAEILTDIEFIELRYSGASAAFLRAFKSIYLGIFMNVIIMGWVNVALVEIFKIIFGVPEQQVFLYVILSMVLVGVYSALSGLWGISYTDMFQFIFAMTGCIVLAVVVLGVPEVGGIDGLRQKLPREVFSFFPSVNMGADDFVAGILTLSASSFFAYIFIQWWASWYPGSEPGGGGYVAQRMMSSKDEKNSQIATLWFTVAHFAIRPWPWILVALSTMVLYANLPPEDAKTGYVLAMRDYLPAGLLGLLVASFLAAYMSTIATHLNWGSSYIINDLYKRFIRRDDTERHYVFISRLIIMLLVVASSLMIFVIKSISGAWAFIIECGAGLGLVLILRWYWWRVNAWSEIVAMIAPIAGYCINLLFIGLQFPRSLFFLVSFTTISWLIATLLTKPVEAEKLRSFYLRVKPGGPGWKHIREELQITGTESLVPLFGSWIIGIIVVYSSLFCIGNLIFSNYIIAGILFLVALVGFSILRMALK